jgi:hypothetical protein
MERAVEVFVAITALVIGTSHLLRPGDWAAPFCELSRAGRLGAFVNGGLSLIPGAGIVAGHGTWTWPGAVLTGFGWLLVVKGAVCLLAPDTALRSMERGGRTPRGFVAAGIAVLMVSAWACYCVWQRAPG